MFSTNSLFKKTFFLIVSSLVTIVTIFNYLSINNKENSLLDVMYSKAKTIVKSIALVSSDAMVVQDYSFIVQHNEKVIEDNKEIIYILVHKKGENQTIIYNSSNSWKILDRLPDKLLQINSTQEKSAILKSSISNKEKVYHFSYPVVFSGIEWGWVSIGFSLETYNKQMKDIYLNSIFLLVATLIASFLFSYILAKWLIEPILTLNNATKRVSSGDFDVEVNISSNDEIGQLSNSFNYMVNYIKMDNEKLLNYNEELELRVNERTNELSKLNKELDQRVKDEIHKRAEQEEILIQQSRFAAMGEMIGNIAHQWRQPLNALGLLLQNIENAYEMDILDKAYINRTINKGNRLTNSMSQTIDDFRNFFKPNKESEVFSISSSLHNTMGMIRSSLEHNMITISENVDTSVYIKGFSSEFSQVILNVLNNARDALLENKSDDRQLYIRVFKDDENAYLEIEDNAGGIPSNVLDKIFDPYFTTKEEGKGTGIGLYMSKTIIENNMHGLLKVHNSEYGAKFTIIIESELSKG